MIVIILLNIQIYECKNDLIIKQLNINLKVHTIKYNETIIIIYE